MSIASIAARTADAAVEAPPSPPPDATGTAGSLTSSLATLAAWIPSEAVGIYALGYSFLALHDPGGVTTLLERWLIYLVAVVLTVFLLAFQTFGALRTRRNEGKTIDSGRRVGAAARFVGVTVLSVLALTIYIANIPDNPFAGALSAYNPGWLPLAAILAAIMVPALGEWLNVTAPTAPGDGGQNNGEQNGGQDSAETA
jgi:hypothetical protein